MRSAIKSWRNLASSLQYVAKDILFLIINRIYSSDAVCSLPLRITKSEVVITSGYGTNIGTEAALARIFSETAQKDRGVKSARLSKTATRPFTSRELPESQQTSASEQERISKWFLGPSTMESWQECSNFSKRGKANSRHRDGRPVHISKTFTHTTNRRWLIEIRWNKLEPHQIMSASRRVLSLASGRSNVVARRTQHRLKHYLAADSKESRFVILLVVI